MAKGFNLQLLRCLLPDGADLLKAQFSCQNHPLGTHIIPGVGTFVVRNGLLGGNMPGAVGSVFARKSEGTQIRKDQRIYFGILKLLQICRQADDLIISGHSVHSYMDTDPVAVGKLHSFRKLLWGKIARKGAHTEVGTRQINGIRTVKYRHFKPFHIPSRTQKLQFSHIYPSSLLSFSCCARVWEKRCTPASLS